VNVGSKVVYISFKMFFFLSENDSTSKGLILVLDSATSVRWRLSFLGAASDSYKRVLFLSHDSSVHSSNAAIASYGNLEQVTNSEKSGLGQKAHVQEAVGIPLYTRYSSS
jgi:hypothetical protein